jgi:signal transduction histidine kinase
MRDAMTNDEVRPRGPVVKSLFDLDGNRKNLNSCLKDLQEEIDFLIHEIRTPLTAVSGSAQYLQENNLSREERNHWLATIRNEVRRINSLLDDFTRLNAPGSWLSSINFSALKIPDLLLEVIEVFQDSSPKHFIRVDVPPDLPSVCGDRKKLGMVLRNLVANAIKYSPQGGIVLISAERHRHQIVICVRDEGLGISQGDQAAIFERSFRVYRPEGMRMRGAGLGLALVRRIVENHGGCVWVESLPGKGSTFSFSLPTGD